MVRPQAVLASLGQRDETLLKAALGYPLLNAVTMLGRFLHATENSPLPFGSKSSSSRIGRLGVSDSRSNVRISYGKIKNFRFLT
ncbi:hypothetical protein Q31a_48030 [Aureliella helgolandensis]|uniref:Uncharacterized protein n=1 Tax=Aureliella helgolandensis TaxID=2527968 RepID=A0A518GCW0_9BACT|nr:hypothetical protein Q31a_48030 [Aureliella helgolandensis]